MKKVWFAIVFIAAIFSVNFIYARRITAFSDSISSIAYQAVYYADTDYEICGKYIDALLEEIDKSELLLYSFSNRGSVGAIELSSKSVAEYYKSGNKENLKHELLMLVHKVDDLKFPGEFNLKNIL